MSIYKQPFCAAQTDLFQQNIKEEELQLLFIEAISAVDILWFLSS